MKFELLAAIIFVILAPLAIHVHLTTPGDLNKIIYTIIACVLLIPGLLWSFAATGIALNCKPGGEDMEDILKAFCCFSITSLFMYLPVAIAWYSSEPSSILMHVTGIYCGFVGLMWFIQGLVLMMVGPNDGLA